MTCSSASAAAYASPHRCARMAPHSALRATMAAPGGELLAMSGRTDRVMRQERGHAAAAHEQAPKARPHPEEVRTVASAPLGRVRLAPRRHEAHGMERYGDSDSVTHWGPRLRPRRPGRGGAPHAASRRPARPWQGWRRTHRSRARESPAACPWSGRRPS